MPRTWHERYRALRRRLRQDPLPGPWSTHIADAKKRALAWLRTPADAWEDDPCCTTIPQHVALLPALRGAALRHGRYREILDHPELGTLSYAHLFRQVRRWSRRLAGYPQRYAGILTIDGANSLILMLALQRLGKIPVLLDPRLDSASLLACCQTIRLGLVYASRTALQQARLDQHLKGLSPHLQVILLENLHGANRLPLRLPQPRADDPALVSFSRPPGEPCRALRFTHRQLLSAVAQLYSLLQPGSTDTVLCLLPNTHPLGLLAGRLLPLLQGARSATAPMGLTAEQLPARIQATNARVLITTGNALEPCYRSAQPRQLLSLHQVWIPAGTLGREARQRWVERVGCRPLEFHAPAPLGAMVAIEPPHTYQPAGLSHPLPELHWRLASSNADSSEVSPLWVRGPHLAGAVACADHPGYWRSTSRHDWWYTGDLVSIVAGGAWRFRGRLARHTRVGKQWISLATLEQLLYQRWPEERHLVLELGGGDQGVLTLLTTSQQLSPAGLARLLRASGLDEHWLPSRVIVVGDWPLAATGEPNQLALRQLAETLVSLDTHTQH